MKNRTLARDYINRAGHRLASVDVLFERKSWADVVREAQEIVELALKSLLRASLVEVPRIHDVSDILQAERERLPESARPHVARLSSISRSLRRDRELAFYGSEDLTPSEFYRRADAEQARSDAHWVVSIVSDAVIRRRPGRKA